MRIERDPLLHGSVSGWFDGCNRGCWGALTPSRGVEVALGGMGTLIGPRVEVPIKLGDS
jgi:hypothetical protein